MRLWRLGAASQLCDGCVSTLSGVVQKEQPPFPSAQSLASEAADCRNGGCPCKKDRVGRASGLLHTAVKWPRCVRAESPGRHRWLAEAAGNVSPSNFLTKEELPLRSWPLVTGQRGLFSTWCHLLFSQGENNGPSPSPTTTESFSSDSFYYVYYASHLVNGVC